MGRAAVSVRVDDRSLSGLLGRLAGLSRKLAKGALRKGINEVTKEVLRAARANVPRRTGQLRKALGRVIRVRRDGKGVLGKVGPRSGFRIMGPGGTPVDPVRYAHLVEYGRKAVTAGAAKGKTTGKKVLAGGAMVNGKRAIVFGTRARAVAPSRFLTRAWESVKPRTVAIIEKYIRAGIVQHYRGRGVASAAA